MNNRKFGALACAAMVSAGLILPLTGCSSASAPGGQDLSQDLQELQMDEAQATSASLAKEEFLSIYSPLAHHTGYGNADSGELYPSGEKAQWGGHGIEVIRGASEIYTEHYFELKFLNEDIQNTYDSSEGLVLTIKDPVSSEIIKVSQLNDAEGKPLPAFDTLPVQYGHYDGQLWAYVLESDTFDDATSLDKAVSRINLWSVNLSDPNFEVYQDHVLLDSEYDDNELVKNDFALENSSIFSLIETKEHYLAAGPEIRKVNNIDSTILREYLIFSDDPGNGGFGEFVSVRDGELIYTEGTHGESGEVEHYLKRSDGTKSLIVAATNYAQTELAEICATEDNYMVSRGGLIFDLDTLTEVGKIDLGSDLDGEGACPSLDSSPNGKYLVYGNFAYDIGKNKTFSFAESESQEAIYFRAVSNEGIAYGVDSSETALVEFDIESNDNQSGLVLIDAAGKDIPHMVDVTEAGDLILSSVGLDDSFANGNDLLVHKPEVITAD